jgi:hypothetical protein
LGVEVPGGLCGSNLAVNLLRALATGQA